MNSQITGVMGYSASRGFTLIELIVVVVILGVLAAFALPRFTNLNDQAELAQVQGVAGAFSSGVQTVKALYRAQGHSVRVQNLAGYGDGTLDTNDLGFPIGIHKGTAADNIGNSSGGCDGIWKGMLIDPPTVAFNNDNQQYRSYRHTDKRVCSYVYRGSGDTGNQSTGLLVIKYDSRDGSVVACGQSSDLPAC